MASNTKLYIHLVWATWDRLPLITPSIESRLLAAVSAKCRELACTPLAIGIVPDHVHVLVRIPPTLPVSTLVKELKGSSSHLMTHEATPHSFFKWQGSYGAFSVGEDHIGSVTVYVMNQKRHHAAGSCLPNWEEIGRDHNASRIASKDASRDG